MKVFKRTKTAGRNLSVSRLMKYSNCAHKNLKVGESKDSKYGRLIDLSGKATVDQKLGLPGVNLPAISLNVGEISRTRLLLAFFFSSVLRRELLMQNDENGIKWKCDKSEQCE